VKRLIVGLTGPNAAGKGEIARLLQERGFVLHSLSDIVREEARARGLSAARAHLIRIGNDLRARGGPGVLAERVLGRLGRRDVVDSIRTPAEVAVLRGIPGFLLLGVDASVEERFRRSRSRARPGDAESLAEFREREAQENTSDPAAQQLEATLRLADRIVQNRGSLADLARAVDALVADLERRNEPRSSVDRSGGRPIQ
jgi:dephospho-CoA kinase